MPRKDPSRATIKQLFAVSGNQCAFPGCIEKLVDGDNILGEICHIEAADKGGERYNPSQTEDERAAFPNLILLCPKHHIITNDIKKYTVEALKEMKASHAKRFAESPYQPTEEAVNKIQQINNQYTNSGSGVLAVINTENTQIVTGITLKDATDLFSLLFDQNFPRLKEAAQEEARRRVEELRKEFDKAAAASTLSPEELNRFSDPELQVALNTAVQASACKDDEGLRKSLADLLVKKLRTDVYSLTNTILSEAIATIGKLTVNQLRIISLSFSCTWMTLREKPSLNAFSAFLNKYVMPFLAGTASNIDFAHIEYCGCGTIGIGQTVLQDHWRRNFPWLFVRSFGEDELSTLSKVAADAIRTYAVCENGKYRFLLPGQAEIVKILKDNGIVQSAIDEVLSLHQRHIGDIIIPEDGSDMIERIRRTWEASTIKNMHLTSVGVAIAITYISSVVKERLDHNIWLSAQE